jgi:hypothetical protein
MAKPKDYRSHRMPSNYRKTAGGKGDRDRSDPSKYREGYDRVFDKRPDPLEDRDLSWLDEDTEETSDE